MIPGNDDAIRAVKLIVSKMADAVIEANQGAEEEVYEGTDVETEEAPVEGVIIIRRRECKNGYYSSNGKRTERNDRRRHDGLQKGSD